MVGSIDPRCETVRGTHWPKAGRRLCLELASRKTILASGKTQPHQQAGHMDASDPIKPEKTLVAWGPTWSFVAASCERVTRAYAIHRFHVSNSSRHLLTRLRDLAAHFARGLL